MSDPLTPSQHGYTKRALQAFETVAESLERIANTLEASSNSKPAAETKSQTQRTEIEPSGRYEKLAIDGVPAQSVAIDYGTEPPELIVHADGTRQPASSNPEMPTHIIRLPDSNP